jgi:hypothetical protein
VEINKEEKCCSERQAAIIADVATTLHILTTRWQQCIEE